MKALHLLGSPYDLRFKNLWNMGMLMGLHREKSNNAVFDSTLLIRINFKTCCLNKRVKKLTV